MTPFRPSDSLVLASEGTEHTCAAQSQRQAKYTTAHAPNLLPTHMAHSEALSLPKGEMGCGDGSVRKTVAVQARGPKSDLQTPHGVKGWRAMAFLGQHFIFLTSTTYWSLHFTFDLTLTASHPTLSETSHRKPTLLHSAYPLRTPSKRLGNSSMTCNSHILHAFRNVHLMDNTRSAVSLDNSCPAPWIMVASESLDDSGLGNTWLDRLL